LSMSEVPSKICGRTVSDCGSTYLDDGLLSLDLKDLTFPYDSVSETDVDDLCVLGELDVVENDERPFDVEDGPVVDSGGNVVVLGDCLNVSVD